MDHVSYDDDGTPVLREAAGRRRYTTPGSWPGDLADIFEIDGHSYDVVFSQNKITWNSVTGSAKVPKARKKSFFKKRQKSMSQPRDDDNDPNTLILKNIIGVKIKRLRQANQKEGEGLCQGVAIYSFDRKNVQRYKERIFVLGHPSEQICVRWSQRLQQIIEGFEGRPKKMKVFMQPFAGKKISRSIYNYQVNPLFEAAGITAEVVEVSHDEHIKQEMIHIDLALYDCLVCVGGDGTVSKVISGLMTKTQKDMGIDMENKMGTRPAKSPIPVGIIPTGMTNTIVHSVQGIDDPVTATIHIILGHQQPVDICSVYNEDKLSTWSFNCHYGYFGAVLTYLIRYSLFGEKKLDAAFMKALGKTKFRAYECEIQYIPSPETYGHPMDGNTCRQGCQVCHTDLSSSQQSGSTFCDEVQALDPFNESNTSSGIIDLATETPAGGDVQWKTLKGNFLNISLYSIPGLSDMAPQGCSKYTHLSNGALDLVLVKNTDRKEFVRYLKRHGNAKNQFNFPFIETYRCKEVRFHIRMNNTWEHKDYNYSEISYELDKRRVSKTAEMSAQSQSKNQELVFELTDSDTSEDEGTIGNGSMASGKNSASSQGSRTGSHRKPHKKDGKHRPQKKPSPSSNQDAVHGFHNEAVETDDIDLQSDQEINPVGMFERHEVEDFENLAFEAEQDGGVSWATTSQAGSSHQTDNPPSSLSNLQHVNVSSSYHPTFMEQERARRARHRRKKDEKRKDKDNARIKSVWNIDNEMCTNLDLQFKIHPGLLQLYGQGVWPEYEPDEVNPTCLSLY